MPKTIDGNSEKQINKQTTFVFFHMDKVTKKREINDRTMYFQKKIVLKIVLLICFKHQSIEIIHISTLLVM